MATKYEGRESSNKYKPQNCINGNVLLTNAHKDTMINRKKFAGY